MLDFEEWVAGVVGMATGAFGMALVLVLACGPEAEGSMEQTSSESVAVVAATTQDVVVVEPEVVACWPREVVGESHRPVGGCGEFATIVIPWVLPAVLRRRRTKEPDMEGPLVQTPEVFVVRRESPGGQVSWVTGYNVATLEITFSTSPSRAKVFRGAAWAKFWRDQGDELVAAEIGGVA